MDVLTSASLSKSQWAALLCEASGNDEKCRETHTVSVVWLQPSGSLSEPDRLQCTEPCLSANLCYSMKFNAYYLLQVHFLTSTFTVGLLLSCICTYLKVEKMHKKCYKKKIFKYIITKYKIWRLIWIWIGLNDFQKSKTEIQRSSIINDDDDVNLMSFKLQNQCSLSLFLCVFFHVHHVTSPQAGLQ